MAKNSTLDAEIKSRIDSFASELAELVRRAALESVQSALGGATAEAAPRRGGRRKAARRAGRGRRAAKPVAASSRGKRGPGRPANPAVASMMPEVLTFVKGNDGAGISDIAKALRKKATQIKPVLVKLLGEKKLKKSGQKRGTKYHAR